MCNICHLMVLTPVKIMEDTFRFRRVDMNFLLKLNIEMMVSYHMVETLFIYRHYWYPNELHIKCYPIHYLRRFVLTCVWKLITLSQIYLRNMKAKSRPVNLKKIKRKSMLHLILNLKEMNYFRLYRIRSQNTLRDQRDRIIKKKYPSDIGSLELRWNSKMGLDFFLIFVIFFSIYFWLNWECLDR